MDVANTEFRPRMCTEPVLYLFGPGGRGDLDAGQQ